jgi:hypothetical protein
MDARAVADSTQNDNLCGHAQLRPPITRARRRLRARHATAQSSPSAIASGGPGRASKAGGPNERTDRLTFARKLPVW